MFGDDEATLMVRPEEAATERRQREMPTTPRERRPAPPAVHSAPMLLTKPARDDLSVTAQSPVALRQAAWSAAPGEVIAGRYRVRAVLGRARGLLVDADHVAFEQRVAIRIIAPAIADGREVERFHRETRLLARLESEHAARILDAGTLPCGSLYLVREHLDGSNLRDLLANTGPLAVEQAVELVLQLGEAVQQVHGHGIVLRDLRLDHVFVVRRRTGAWQAKLTDFGTCKVLREVSHDDAAPTCTQLFSLSPYASPEVVQRAADIDARADVWSLGAILYQLLTGRAPFGGDGPALMLAICREQPVPPSAYRPDLPRALDAIIGAALTKQRDGRFPSVYALAQELRAFAAATGQVLCDQIADLAGAPRARSWAPIAPAAPWVPAAVPSAPGSGDRLTPEPFTAPKLPSFAPAAFAARPALDTLAGMEQRRARTKTALRASLVAVPALVTLIVLLIAGSSEATKLEGKLALSQHVSALALARPAVAEQQASDSAPAPRAPKAKKDDKKRSVAREDAPALPAEPVEEAPASAAPAEPVAVPAPAQKSEPAPRRNAIVDRPRKPEDKKSTSNTGTIVATAIGGTCRFAVDGKAHGASSSVRVTVHPGAHTVVCRSLTGEARSRNVKVEPGRAAVAVFKF